MQHFYIIFSLSQWGPITPETYSTLRYWAHMPIMNSQWDPHANMDMLAEQIINVHEFESYLSPC